MNLHSTFDLNDENLISALDEVNLWSAPFGLKLLDMIKYKPGIKALDIGFGSGFPLIELAMRLGSNSGVYGIDPWTQGIERAKKKINALGLDNISIIEGVAESMPFVNDFFDLIVSNNGINNVSNIDQTLSECSRILKPGSQFLFSVNLQYSFNEFYIVFRQVLKEYCMEGQIKELEKHIYSKRKPVAEIVMGLENAGFIVNNIYHDNFKFRYADGTAFFNHYFIRLAFLPEWIKIVPEKQLESVFNSIESELNRIAAVSKGLTLTIPFAVFDCKSK